MSLVMFAYNQFICVLAFEYGFQRYLINESNKQQIMNFKIYLFTMITISIKYVLFSQKALIFFFKYFLTVASLQKRACNKQNVKKMFNKLETETKLYLTLAYLICSCLICNNHANAYHYGFSLISLLLCRK